MPPRKKRAAAAPDIAPKVKKEKIEEDLLRLEEDPKAEEKNVTANEDQQRVVSFLNATKDVRSRNV